MRVVVFGALLPGRTQIDPKADLCPLVETRFRILRPERNLALYRSVQLRWIFSSHSTPASETEKSFPPTLDLGFSLFRSKLAQQTSAFDVQSSSRLDTPKHAVHRLGVLSKRRHVSWVLARARRPVALDGLRVRRVGAHVDALLPGALERIADVEAHAPDAVNLEVDDLAVLERPQAFVVRAARDEVARVERHDGRGELDQLRDLVLHVVGVVVVPELAVDPELDVDVVGIRDLVERGDAGADGRERVERLAEPAAGFPGAPALAARRDVDHAGIAKDGGSPVVALDQLGRSLDDQRQLGLVHEDPRLGELR